MVCSSASSSSLMIGLAALTSMMAVGGFIHPNYCHRTTLTSTSLMTSSPSGGVLFCNGNKEALTRLCMSLSDDGPSSSSFGSNSGGAGGGNVESDSGEGTVRRYADASFFGSESERRRHHGSSSRDSEASDDAVSRRFSNAALGGEFDVNNLSERTTRVVSDTRRARWARESAAKSKFATGDDLHDMRSRIVGLRNELLDIKMSMSNSGLSATMGQGMFNNTDTKFDTQRRNKAREIENEITQLNDRDPEFVYAMSIELMKRAVVEGDTDGINEYKYKMEDAMSCMPQMNLHGLWVGKYGEHGYEMINVTYANEGQTLIATKVTGDENVPRGEVTFTVDLAPRTSSNDDDLLRRILDPIELDSDARRRWGRRYLPRHPGRGRVAQTNFVDPAWMEGQMILVGDFFSFAWVPIGKQIFFGRPSPELTLRMMKEAEVGMMRRGSSSEGDGEVNIDTMRDVARGMLEETYWVEREGADDNNDYNNSLGGEGSFE